MQWLCLTALQADQAPPGSPHPGALRTRQSMLVEATAMKALPSLMPKWPHSHGWQLVLACIWELIWGCQLGSLHGASPCGLGILQHGNRVPGVNVLRAGFPEPQVEAVRLRMIELQRSQNIISATFYGWSESPRPVQIQGEGHETLGWHRPTAEEQVG